MYKVFAVLVILVAVTLADDKYSTKYDGINLDEILQNERLLTSYIDCLKDTGNCTPDGADLKSE